MLACCYPPFPPSIPSSPFRYGQTPQRRREGVSSYLSLSWKSAPGHKKRWTLFLHPLDRLNLLHSPVCTVYYTLHRSTQVSQSSTARPEFGSMKLCGIFSLFPLHHFLLPSFFSGQKIRQSDQPHLSFVEGGGEGAKPPPPFFSPTHSSTYIYDQAGKCFTRCQPKRREETAASISGRRGIKEGRKEELDRKKKTTTRKGRREKGRGESHTPFFMQQPKPRHFSATL